MDKPVIIYFCGPHGSGKTTILHTLYEKGFFSSIGSEIGKDLFYQDKFDTERQDEKFELTVSYKELERDKNFVNEHGVIGIETWHPGNLAYAMERNPRSVAKLLSIMKQSPLITDACGFHLSIPKETIYKRTITFCDKRDWAAEFYTKIDRNLGLCLSYLGLKERCILIDANRDLNLVIEDVESIILNSTNFNTDY